MEEVTLKKLNVFVINEKWALGDIFIPTESLFVSNKMVFSGIINAESLKKEKRKKSIKKEKRK